VPRMRLTEQATEGSFTKPAARRSAPGFMCETPPNPPRKLVGPSEGRKQLPGTHRAKGLGPDELLRMSEPEVVCAVAQITKPTTAAPWVLCGGRKRRAELA
jgi:hypothetical protein